MPPELVRCTNTGERPFSDRYANIPYHLNPGDSIMAPWAAVVLWFGNPELVDKPTIGVMDRQDEVERIYTMYGAYDGDGLSRAERFFLNRPHIRCDSMDGEQITMLIDALDGTAVAPPPSTGMDERTALATELERMKAIQADLLHRLSQVEAQSDTFDDLPTDNPTKIPVDEGAR